MTRQDLDEEVLEAFPSDLAGDCGFLWLVFEYVKNFGQEEPPLAGVD